MKCPRCNGNGKELYRRIEDIMGWTNINTPCTFCRGSGEVKIDPSKNGADRYIPLEPVDTWKRKVKK